MSLWLIHGPYCRGGGPELATRDHKQTAPLWVKNDSYLSVPLLNSQHVTRKVQVIQILIHNVPLANTWPILLSMLSIHIVLIHVYFKISM